MIEKMDKYFEKKLAAMWGGHPATLLGRHLGNGAPERANSRYGQIWTNKKGVITRADVMGYGGLIWVSGLPENIQTEEIPAVFWGRSPYVYKLGRHSDRWVDAKRIQPDWRDIGTDRTDPNPHIAYNGSTQRQWVREAFERAGFPAPPETEVPVEFVGKEMIISYAYVEEVVWSYKADKRRTFCNGVIRSAKVGPTTAAVWEIPGPFLEISDWGGSYSESTSRDVDGMWNK